MTILGRRETNTIEILDSESVAAGGTITHSAVHSGNYAGLTVLISTDQDCSVWVQFSNDQTNWYSLTDAAGTTLKYNVNNEKKAIGVNDISDYIRIVIYNNAGSSATIDLDLVGLV